MSAAETPQAVAPPNSQPKPNTPAQPTERPPQTEEVLCTICGMRSCWR
jgi:hypothetical protein